MPVKPFDRFLTLAVLAVLMCFSGCSNSSSTNVAVTLLPGTQQLCDAGQTVLFSAAVSNDASNGGVTWTLSGAGSLSSATSIHVVYTAPATVATAFTATLTATSHASNTAVTTASIIVTPPPAISTTSLPNGAVNAAYSATLQSTGGVTPLNWSVLSGALPPGLTLNASTGVISGTPTANGGSSFTVQLTDFSTPQISVTMPLTLIVGQALSVSTSSIPAGEYGVAYSTTLAAAGGSAPYTWSVSAGTLPPGVTLSSAGVLGGTPTGSGSFSFTAQAKDAGSPQQTATKQFTLSIAPQLVVTNTSLPSVAIHNAYNISLTATGGIGADTWSLASGSTLPAGLTLSSTGLLSGTPATAGTTNFTVQIADSGTPPQTATRQLTLTVSPALSIATTSLADGAVGSGYSATLLSLGGTTPVTWNLASGSSLPSGLALNSATGVISGIPGASGVFSFTVKALDASTPQQTAMQALTLTLSAPAPLTITTASLPNGIAGTDYSATLVASGGVAPLTWSISTGSLPAVLLLNSATGLISGKPNASGITTFTVQVADSESPVVTKTMTYTLTINGTLGSGVNNAEIKGSYAFLFHGFNNGNATGKVYGTAAIGTITADGNGNITGVEDLNSISGVQTQIAITGQYALGADNRGTMVVNNGSALATYSIVAGSVTSGVAQKLHFIAFDNTSASNPGGVVGTGLGKLQTVAAFVPGTLHGSFVFGLQGETPCNTCAAIATPYGPIAAAGLLTGDGSGNLSGQEDAGAVNTSYTGITLGGTYTSPGSSTGRGIMSVTETGSIYPAAPADFIYYIVNANEMMMMSSDSHAAFSLLSGDLQLQQQTSYNTSSPTGTLIAYESNSSGGDGAALYPAAANATISMLTITGAGTASLSQDMNKAGVFSTPAVTALTFSVAGNGRMPITSGGSAPVFYLYSNTAGFGVDLPQPGSDPGLIQFEAQTITTSFPSFLTGTFTDAAVPPSVPANMISGIAALTANTGGIDVGSVSGSSVFTLDSSAPTGTLLSAQSASMLYVESSTGRTVFTSSGSSTVQSVVYAISPSKAVQIGTGSSSQQLVTVLEK